MCTACILSTIAQLINISFVTHITQPDSENTTTDKS